MWLLDALPRDLTGVRVLIYGYDTRLTGSKSFQNINDLGTKFRTDLKVIRGESIIQMPSGDPSDQATLKSIRGLLLFGVPNRGMATESLIPMVEGQPNRPLVDALDEGNGTLRAQAGRFPAAFAFRDAEIVSFYETSQSPTAQQVDGVWRMTGEPAVLVDRDSATYGREWELGDRYVYPVNQTHSNMVKFNGFDDDTYRVVVYHLKSFKENADRIVGGRFMDVA
ncbi:putative ankyrin repeat protein [Neofusicoccum parvum UCRNP2]|uniref:Putative ankyrin repeat protein n=1 Tax=Botryosphaeria parva (strain UCR-NP2) TaxID=1287680 RepID=R1FXN3_BOTPV|nr:putative ankyrin repeat protein [Neofusicoccum parvum UCRNP2]